MTKQFEVVFVNGDWKKVDGEYQSHILFCYGYIFMIE